MNPADRDGSVWKRVIGIVGGLGPYAHVELERLILEAASRRLGRALCDQDYPEWIVSSVPGTPDRTLALLGEVASPLPWLERSLRRLCGTPENPGADFAVIACTTAHAYLEELRRRVPLPILDMIEESVSAAAGQLGRGGRIGVLGTTGTLRSGLYEAAVRRCSRPLAVVSLLDLEEGDRLQEELVMCPVYGALVDGRRALEGIKSGIASRARIEEAAKRLSRAVTLLASIGAELVISACTEIPLALPCASVEGVPLLNPMKVAAEACVEIALGERPLPA